MNKGDYVIVKRGRCWHPGFVLSENADGTINIEYNVHKGGWNRLTAGTFQAKDVKPDAMVQQLLNKLPTR